MSVFSSLHTFFKGNNNPSAKKSSKQQHLSQNTYSSLVKLFEIDESSQLKAKKYFQVHTPQEENQSDEEQINHSAKIK